jgi:ubiquinone/menaquinone biosynthesis C-methylase UbiE
MGNYDEFAEEYAQLTKNLEDQTRERLYALLPDSLENKLVLDVGCGSGHDAIVYRSKEACVYGIDISEKEIRMARAQVDGEFKVGSMNELPYENNQFDCVTSMYALQTSTDVEKALQEMIRVVKPGGTINVVTKHPIRNLLEGHVNDGQSDYFNQGIVTSKIFRGKIVLHEPGHTMQQYLHPTILQEVRLTHFEEHEDYPASDQVIEGLKYPTYMILQYTKND